MKEELLYQILEELKKNHKLQAKRLEKLLKEYQSAENEEQKEVIRRKIVNYVYHVFCQQLSPKTRQRLSDLNSSIGEYCYQIEQKEQRQWYIGYDGAFRRGFEGNEIVVKNIIPREYQKGFYLSNELPESKEDRIKEGTFLKKYRVQLDTISDMMDKKIDIQSGNYELKNDRIDPNFVALLIEFLELRRINFEKEKVYTK